MDENVDAALRVGALQLSLVTAAIHLWVGWPRLFVYVQAGTPFIDPLQILFVLSSLAVLAGVGLAAWGLRRDYVYALGVALMLCYLLGWVFLGGHRTGGALIAPAWETTAHSHGTAVATLFEHLVADWLLLVSKVVEATALVVLLALLYGERTTDDDPTTESRTDDPTAENRNDDPTGTDP
ncbi:hypothetical protein [Halorubellus salinus]|uniref:hypothetical protein n=1 Tax=Halorubellus salinus TaxID=755309 RepID=UPI001D09981C|nr:hypothetical protein [Halorubellus salinus]